MGDEFSTYDYIVRVTEVFGSEATGWTGKGELLMNFLKIGGRPVVEIPLAVKFENMHLNQCYQILPGSKVVTEFDESWSNVVDVDNIVSTLDKTLQEILDFLKVYEDTPANKAKLNDYLEDLNNQKGSFNSSDLNPNFKQQIVTHIEQTNSTLSCLANSSPGARVVNSCTVDDAISQVEQANTAIAPIIVWAIKTGGQCLVAAALDIATQYTLEGSLLWLDGKVNSLADYGTIWPKVSYLQAGGTCVESFFNCTPCSAGINGVTSITQSLTAEYNKHGEDVEKYDWKGIGTNLFVDVAASYIGNVAGRELAEYFTKINSRILQQGYHQVRNSLRKFLPDNLADMLMHKASGLLTAAGKFADNVLEGDYLKYTQRKQKEGKAAKDRLSWLETVEYFQNKTNVPRGNAFNRSRRDAYEYNEVTLVNGKRVDSYTPPRNGARGQIVSRKATELIDIDERTFKSYLPEMKTKYAPPIGIKKTTQSNMAGIGSVLEGDMFLEIPMSNNSYSDLERYKSIQNHMELQLDSLQNNQEYFRRFFDEVNFYDRVIYLKHKYLFYDKDGKFIHDLKSFTSKKTKKEILEKVLINAGYPIKFSKQDWVLSFSKRKGDFIVSGRFQIDETSVGGSIGVYYKKEDPEYMIIGGLFDRFLETYYNYINVSYRFCAMSEDDVIDISTAILSVFEDFSEAFFRSV